MSSHAHRRDPLNGSLIVGFVDAHLIENHGLTEAAVAEMGSWRGAHEELHRLSEELEVEVRKHLIPRCTDAGHFVPVGAETCDCGLERTVLP